MEISMVTLKVTDNDILMAKEQIAEFEQIPEGAWRYEDVEAWRGIVCKMITSKWLENNFKVKEKAIGLEATGIVDDEYDLLINEKKIEIKSATKNYFRYLMPKIYDVENKPKDFYIGAKYNETITPNEVPVNILNTNTFD